MPFKFTQRLSRHRIPLVACLWFLFITLAHLQMNGERDKRKTVKMGYMPVITNLAAPILDKASRQNGPIYYQAIKFSSFSEMGEALRNNSIDVAFMIAPLSIVLKQQGLDVKIVYIGNRHESTLVVKKGLQHNDFSDLAGKTLAVPMRFSGHNILSLELREKFGLTETMTIVEMNPPDMPAALLSGGLDAYFVGEPFASSTLFTKDAEVLFHVEDIEPDFICNLMLVKNDFIINERSVVSRLVEGAARSGIWAQNNLEEAAVIASEYWNQPGEITRYALMNQSGRTVFHNFKPHENELQRLADRMTRQEMIKTNDITGLVDDFFANEANLENINGISTILR